MNATLHNPERQDSMTTTTTTPTPEQVVSDVYWTMGDFPDDPNGDDLRALMARAIEADRAQRAEFPDTERGEDYADDWENFKDAATIDVTLTGRNASGLAVTFYTGLSLTPAELRAALLALAVTE